MTDANLQSRLRTDAERSIAPPDFAAALAAVTSEPHASSSPARRWLAVAAVVLVVAGGASVLSNSTTSRDKHSGLASSGSRLPTNSFVSRIGGVVLLPSDPSGRTLVVYATAPGKRMKGYGCVGSTALKTTQTPTGVRLHATARFNKDGAIGCDSAGYRDPETGQYFVARMLRLDDPLRRRSVVDDVTGEQLTVFQPTVLKTGYLPSGYAPQYKGNVTLSTSFWYDERPGFLSPIAVNTEYKAKLSGPRLGIISAPTGVVNAGGTVLEHVQIQGADATVTDSPHARCVTWSPDGHSGRQVCSYADIVDPLGRYQKKVVQIDTSLLVKVARALS